MSLVLSPFVVASPLSSGKMALMSTRTGAIAVVTQALYSLLSAGQLDPDAPPARGLGDNGIACRDHEVEMKDVLDEYQLNANTASVVSVTLAPSLACNLACPYCYEQRDDGVVMDERTLTNVGLFMKDRFEKLGAERVVLACYGGEPLLFPRHFLKAYSTLAASIGQERISTIIVTNGSIIPRRLELLNSIVRFSSIQISISPGRDSHDRLRRYRSGNSSYNDVLSGVGKALSLGIPRVMLRVNLTNEDMHGLDDLLRDLETLGLHEDPNLQVYPATVGAISQACNPFRDKCIPISSNFDVILNSLHMLRQRGYFLDKQACKGAYKSFLTPSHCRAHGTGAYVIGPRGWISTCTNFVDVPKYAIGNVNHKPFINPEARERWQRAGYHKVETCLNKGCPLTPACAGGCISYSPEQNIHRCVCMFSMEQAQRFLDSYVSLSLGLSMPIGGNQAAVLRDSSVKPE